MTATSEKKLLDRVAIVTGAGAGIGEAAAHLFAEHGADVQRIVDSTLRVFGRPTILFNNAGINREQRRPLIHIPEEDFDQTIAVNLRGRF